MDYFFGFLSIFVAFFLLGMVAFPKRLTPGSDSKTKLVGPTYWGVYQGADPNDLQTEKQIKVKPAVGVDTVIAGSRTYAQGRGVKMSGQG